MNFAFTAICKVSSGANFAKYLLGTVESIHRSEVSWSTNLIIHLIQHRCSQCVVLIAMITTQFHGMEFKYINCFSLVNLIT
jgi:hypothetical protein